MTSGEIRSRAGFRLPRMGPLLVLPPALRDAFERDTEVQRIRQLRTTIILGLVFYNPYNLSNFILMPDLGWLPTILRTLVTLTAVGLIWSLPRLGAQLREICVTIAMLGASLVPIVLFWLTREELGGYSFSDFHLTAVFACVLLLLRFAAAVTYTAICLVLVLAAVWTQPVVQTELRLALTLQTVTGLTFLLVSNWLIHRMQRQSYLEVWTRTREAAELDAARRSFAALSATDALTGIPNRRRFDEVIAETHARARTGGTPYAVLMIDVDHFKRFNDAYGHPAGDACLRSVAGALMVEVQGAEILVSRYGGEEFAAVLRGGDAEAGGALAERMVRAVEAHGIAHAHRPDGMRAVTVSIGVAAYGETLQDLPTTVIRAADEALYEAKRRGRNRAVLFGGADADAAALSA